MDIIIIIIIYFLNAANFGEKKQMLLNLVKN